MEQASIQWQESLADLRMTAMIGLRVCAARTGSADATCALNLALTVHASTINEMGHVQPNLAVGKAWNSWKGSGVHPLTSF